MIKLKTLTMAFVAIITSICISSCAGHKKGKYDGSIAYEGENTPEVYIEPVFYISNTFRTPGCFWEYNIAYILRDSSGELVKFDNDADYSNYGQIIKFIKAADGGMGYDSGNIGGDLYSQLSGNDPCLIKSGNEDKFQKWKQNHPEDVKKLNKGIADYYKSMVDNVVKYAQGDKDKITDPEIFKKIDKAYYDYHPDQRAFYCEESKYNYKRYSDEEGERTMYAFYGPVVPWYYDDKARCVFSDGTEIPEGTLVLL